MIESKLIPLTTQIKQNRPQKSNPEYTFIFDIDDTLYNQSTGISKIIKKRIHKYAESKGINKKDIQEVCESYSKNYGLAIKGFCKNYKDTDPDEFNDLVDGSIDLPQYVSRNGMLIDFLNSLPFRKYCFTNANYKHAVNVLEALDVTECFDGIFYCQYKAKGDFICKPDEEAYEIVEMVCGVDGSKIFFYDDNERNVVVAKKRGWHARLITETYDVIQAMKDDVDYICGLVPQFSDVVKSLEVCRTLKANIDKTEKSLLLEKHSDENINK